MDMAEYARRGAPKVAGWLAPESAAAIAALAGLQRDRAIAGGIGEIGIHHGKLFLLLYLALAPSERAFAVDLFDRQELNTDASGEGDLAAFRRNLADVGGDLARITLFARDSTTLTAGELQDAVGPVRLMSVDGGHTEAVTCSDLTLAEQVLRPDGLLVLDDLYNERWPAVAAGCFRFLANPAHRLRPFAVTPNKTYFCKDPDMAQAYRQRLARDFPALVLGEAEILDSPVLILGRRTLVNKIRNLPMIRDNPQLYRRLSRLWHKVG